MQRMQQKIAGFTLIELMVVVAIIAILVTIGLAAFRNAQNRANDSRMMAGARSIQAVVEQKYATTTPNVYPASVAGSDFSDNTVPSGVTYTPNASGTGYCIQTAQFKTTDYPGANCTTGCSFGGTKDRFCLQNLQ